MGAYSHQKFDGSTSDIKVLKGESSERNLHGKMLINNTLMGRL